MLRKCLGQIDHKKAKEMIVGVTGIYLSFLLLGLVYEKITNTQYLNSDTNQRELFRISSGLIAVQRSVNFILGSIYMYFTVPKGQQVALPHKNSAIVGFLIWLSCATQTEAMYLVSYPLIIMSKSCNLISVILVGVLCSRVTNKDLKLGPKKIVIAIVVSVGIILFRVFDPEANLQDGKSTQILGLALLLVSLLADGFVPDFKAQIKEKYKPSPIQMLVNINKWCAIFAFIYLIILWQLPTFIMYCIQHLQFTLDMLVLSILSFVGQLFIYRMIKAFQQHIVPFIVTTRKIMTVGLSIIYFKHETSVGQIVAILVVLAVTLYEFISNVVKKEGKQGKSDPKTGVKLVEEIDVKSAKDVNNFDSQSQTNNSER